MGVGVVLGGGVVLDVGVCDLLWFVVGECGLWWDVVVVFV